MLSFGNCGGGLPAAVGAVAADSDVCVAAVACCCTAVWRGPSGLVVAKGVTPAGGAGVALARCCRTGRCAGAHRCGAASGQSAFRRAARAAAVSPVLPACRLGGCTYGAVCAVFKARLIDFCLRCFNSVNLMQIMLLLATMYS